MADVDSIVSVLDGIKEGDGDDIRRLWDGYFERLVRLVGARLPRHALRAYDAEDVALSALHSFCDRAGRGQFPQLGDRDDLWRLLSTIAARKATALIRHQSRTKRGGGHVLGESAIDGPDGGGEAGLAQFLGREPTPDAVAAFAESYERLFSRLTDETLRSVAVLRLEGHSIYEIASALGVARRTIDRKLQLIRSLWDKEGLD